MIHDSVIRNDIHKELLQNEFDELATDLSSCSK
jgi:hypothetical protein